MKLNYFASAEKSTHLKLKNGVFPFRVWSGLVRLRYEFLGKSGGRDMSKRLRAMLLGTEDAVPGDYILGLVAVGGVMAAVLIGMIA